MTLREMADKLRAYEDATVRREYAEALSDYIVACIEKRGVNPLRPAGRCFDLDEADRAYWTLVTDGLSPDYDGATGVAMVSLL